VATTRPLRDPEARKRVATDQSPRLRRGRVVEHGSQRRDGALVLAARKPVADDLIVYLIDALGSVALHKRSRPLAVVNVRGVLRPGKQRIGGPALPEVPGRHGDHANTPQPLPRLLACPLCLGLGGERTGTTKDAGDADVVSQRRVVDLSAPAARRELHDAHASLSRAEAQEIAADDLKRRVRRPHVTDGIPSATKRSIVARLTPMISASSRRPT